MTTFTTIQEIPFAAERAVIINVHTLLCTTLAILSAKRYLDMPLLVIDCPLHGADEREALMRLQQDYDFDLLSLPLRPHGDTLDDLFLHLAGEWIYLVDSDVEVLNDKGVEQMRWMRTHSLVKENKLFGVGMRQVSGFGLPPQERLFHAERMWIPFCALHIPAVREAIENGESFNIASKANYGKMGGGLRRVRNKMDKYGLQYIAKLTDKVLDLFRYRYVGRGIDYTLYDTGAAIYEWLQRHGYIYLDCTFYAYPGYVEHFCGVTRQQMYENEPVCTNLTDIDLTIKHRLSEKYHFDFEHYYGN